MKYNISKELFETVIGEEFNSVNNDYIYMGIKNTKDSARISINDFFFLCKEWAIVNGFSIISGTDGLGQISAYIEELGDGYRCKDFFSNSEQQAVFDSCQWILDNKDKQ